MILATHLLILEITRSRNDEITKKNNKNTKYNEN